MTVFDLRTQNEISAAISDRIKQQVRSRETTAVAEVSHTDANGTVWVRLEGEDKDIPAVVTNASTEIGDKVNVRIANGYAAVTGNVTAPSASTRTVVGNYTEITNRIDVTDGTVELIRTKALTADSALIIDLAAETAKVENLTAAELEAGAAYISTLTAANVTAQNVIADTGKVRNLTAEQLSAATGYISALTAANVTASNLVTDHGTVSNLSANYAHITDGVIDNAKIGHADVNGLSANYAHITNGAIDNATIGHADVTGLSANYAQVNLANVNNAWIENGVLKDASIGDAKIIGVSANKLTAGTIDASNITVTNLNASNITTGTLNGQRIGTGSLSLDKLSEDVYTESEVDDLVDALNGRIDAQIQTYTTDAVPTLNNYPASGWTTSDDKAEHVGDICYVVNSASQADGYTYRFAYDNQTSSYSWILIKDNQVTAALQRLLDAEGDIDDLETFQSTTTSWMTTKDGEVSSLQTNYTTLSGQVAGKVDTSTFNTLSQTVGQNTASISQLTTIVEGISSGSRNYALMTGVEKTASVGALAAGETFTWDIYDLSREYAQMGLEPGEDEVTISFDWSVSNGVTGTTIEAGTDDTPGLFFGTIVTLASARASGHATQTYTVTQALSESAGDTVRLQMTAVDAVPDGMTLSVSKLKLEIGDEATEWTAAPEDMATVSQNVNTVSQTATSNQSRISSLTTTLGTNADGTTKAGDIAHRMTFAETAIEQTANNVLIKATESDTTAAQGGQHIIQSLINVAPSGVTINADKVNIEGAAIFTGNGRLSQTSLDGAYDANGAATTAVSNLTSDLASSSGTTVIDGGHISTNSLSIGQTSGLQSALDDAAKVATNYIFADSTGIKIANANPSTATTYQKQTATSTEFYVGGTKMTDISGGSVTTGDASKSHTTIDYHSMELVDKDGLTYMHISDLRNASGQATLEEHFDETGQTLFKLAMPLHSVLRVVRLDAT